MILIDCELLKHELGLLREKPHNRWSSYEEGRDDALCLALDTIDGLIKKHKAHENKMSCQKINLHHPIKPIKDIWAEIPKGLRFTMDE